MDEQDAPAPLSFALAKIVDPRHGYPGTKKLGCDPTITVIKKEKACGHTKGANLEIDLESRTVTCNKCGEVVNTFDALVAFAKSVDEWESMNQHYQRVRRDLSDIQEIKKRHQESKDAKCKHTRAVPMSSGTRYCPTCAKVLDSETAAAGKIKP